MSVLADFPVFTPITDGGPELRAAIEREVGPLG